MRKKKLPPAKCLDPNFKYNRSEATDLRKTFARIRREMQQKKEPVAENVTVLHKKEKP